MATTDPTHPTRAELDAGLDDIRRAPKDRGSVALIARRPAVGERERLDEAELHPAEGVVGDSWKDRGGPDDPPDPATQLTLMNSRTIARIAGDKARWPLAGDQLFVDLDLSVDNLPPGTRLALGTAVIEISEIPHTGCGKFVERYGLDAMRFVNAPVGKSLRLRGANARVIEPGTVRVGDEVRKL